MKVLAVSGSKRKKGNTASLLKEALLPFEKAGYSIDFIYPGEMNIEGCRGCEGCAKTNRCVIRDDMQGIYDKIREADVLLAGSPTYFYNMTSEMKRFIDRCYCFTSYDKTDRSAWISELEQGPRKYAGLISVCEQNSLEDLGFTAKAMEAAFESLGYMIIFRQKVLHAFKAAEVLEKQEILEIARRNGMRLLKTLELSRK
jgi:multimeric flavodoxin WrbA